MFYAIDDTDKKLYPFTLAIDRSNGSLATSGITIGTGVAMTSGSDMEGCAYDPCSGNVWISDESGAYIREYNPATGAIVRTAPVPAIQKKYSSNYSLEALTISGDGLTMWTSNEEALTVDGDLASASAGSVVRLTRFKRDSVRDNWTPDGEWAYVTDKITTEKDQYSRSGVSGLCALPDGTLLTLERRCYNTSGFFPDFTIKIYQVNFSGATDVSSLSSLKGASYTATKKTQLWTFTDTQSMPNFEGICLGPRLNDGSCVLVLVGDAGSYAEEKLFTLKLTGLNIRTMNFEAPASGIGTPSIVGNNYRFIDGTPLDVALLGDGCDSRGYTNRSDAVVNVTYSLPAHNQNNIAGSVASFTVGADDTLTWTTSNAGVAGGDIFLNDTFEGYAVGAVGSEVAGWTGDGEIVESDYTPPATGYVMQNAAHTKVLDADGEAKRTVPADATATNGNRKLDVMVEIRRSREPLLDLGSGVQIAVAADTNGELCVWHARNEGGVVGNGWTPLSSEKFADGQWVRVGIEVDYSGVCGYARVRLNGSICTTDYGYRNPDGNVAGGAWHRIACTASTISEISLVGTKADDLIVTTLQYASEDSSANGSTGGVPNAWFDENSLPRNAAAQTGIPGYTMADVYHTGVDPYGTDPFKILSFSVYSVPKIQVNGINPGIGYKILRSTTPDFKSGTVTELGASDGTFTPDSETWSTRWTGKGAQPSGAFFKVVAE
ncbi:MAG: esterase-like activity of phytase family protein [Kiritimatiellae bacterium]|nr:esterase-like activity of phytase family protein [Kiritimatiellia bacterium]